MKIRVLALADNGNEIAKVFVKNSVEASIFVKDYLKVKEVNSVLIEKLK